jgi:hypothetical protein
MDEIAENSAEVPQLLRKPLGRKGYVALIGFFSFFLATGSFALWFAFRPGLDLPVRLAMTLVGMGTLGLPASIACIVLHRRWKTGHWLASNEERMRLIARSSVKKGRPAWLRYVPSWLRIGSRNPSGVSLVVAVVWILAAGVYVVQAYRHGFDAWDTFFAAWWVMLASLWIWHLLRKPKAVAGSTELTGS